MRPAIAAIALAAAFAGVADPALAAGDAGGAELAWWFWPLALFVVCFGLGIVAVPAGVGGGVLFVPIVSGFFPFHLDFVRGAGLLVALASALSAGPSLLRAGLADLRLALPARVVQVALGITILGIVALMASAPKSEHGAPVTPDRLAAALAMHGVYHDRATGRDHPWHVHRTPLALVLFTAIGVLAGMFGMGAGWANVPVLNLVMGAPLKVSAGTSSFILSLVDSSAAWVYLHKGATLAVLTVPSVIGMMIGAQIGARLLSVLKASVIRKLVLGLLLFAGLRALQKGLGW